jgi:alanine racemase
MDLITLDVTEVPEQQLQTGTLIDLIGPHYDIDAIAEDAGTIGYEVLTAMGSRYERVYSGNNG